MKSHTVPKRLLEQFAYYDPVTRSKRLWRYQKGKAPYGRATPKSATRWEGHFADPANGSKEAELEERLEREFEHPVNQFLDVIGYRTFVLQPRQIKELTGYLTMLFTRSRARRAASQSEADFIIEAFRSLISDERKLSVLTGKLMMLLVARGMDARMVTREMVVGAIERQIAAHSDAQEPQRCYIQTVESMMRFPGDYTLYGDWFVIHADPAEPFVIGDAPVVTWERTKDNRLYFMRGFAQPNVEVFLPVSPTTCLHVLPGVLRSRPVLRPVTAEVNMAQAVFATEHCFTSIRSPELDAAIQPHFSKMRIGIEGFPVRHIGLKGVLFDFLMGKLRRAA